MEESEQKGRNLVRISSDVTRLPLQRKKCHLYGCKYIVGQDSKPRTSDYYQNDFVTAGIPNTWRTFCQILVSLNPLEPPKKASIILQNIVSMKNSIILVLILPKYHVLPWKRWSKCRNWNCWPRKYAQNDVTQLKLFIMTVKSLLEVQNTNSSEFGCY